MPSVLRSIRALRDAIKEALSNPGIRRLEIGWALGVAADSALLVVLLVEVYLRDGVVAAGVLGAVRMLPAIASGMLAGAILGRVPGRRLLLSIAFARTAVGALVALVIATGQPTAWLYLLAAVGAAAGAPVRPTQATLMPAVARSPGELVAANMAWSTGEGLGSLFGPFVAGLLVAAGAPAIGALAAAAAFLGTALAVVGLRFEHARDASGGAEGSRGLRLRDGLAAMRRRPVVGWSTLGAFSQVATRGLLSPLAVVASIELLGMGEGGVGLLNAALGLGGLVGAVFAVSLTRTDRLARTSMAALAYWGVPIAVIGLIPVPAVALTALVVVGIANAAYDVALFTLLQRGSANEERAPVFSVFEGVVGMGSVVGSLLAPVLLAAFGTRGALAVTGAFLPVLAVIIYSRIGRLDRVSVVDEDSVELLRAVPLFAELPMTGVERLALGLAPVRFEAGATLMREGEPGDRFVVIESGEVEVSVDGRAIARLGRGAGVGEIALLRSSPRTATVTALTDVAGQGIDSACFLAAVSGPAAAAVTEQIVDASLRRGTTAPAATSLPPETLPTSTAASSRDGAPTGRGGSA